MKNIWLILPWVVAVVGAAASFFISWILNNRLGKKSLGESRKKADEILREAKREAEKQKRSAILTAKEEWFHTKNRMEQELKNKMGSLQKFERDLKNWSSNLKEMEASLKKRDELFKEKENRLRASMDELKQKDEQMNRLLKEINVRLERLSGLTRDEAKRQLLTNLKAETRFEAVQMIKEIKDEAQRAADAEAMKIIALAVERLATDCVTEKTVTSFTLPANSNVRGRIIGHEGKNIKAFEKATGVQLILDETPGVAILSAFNPIKREIARSTLEKLLKDGNIHPRKIEEIAEKMKRKVEEQIRVAGEETVKELNVKGINPELINYLGRLKFRSSYGQNVLEHSKEVSLLTGMMASELGLDVRMAKRAGLLHDVGKAIDYEREGTHPEIGEELAQKFGEPEVVVNAIASHHEDVEVISPISVLVSAADTLSGARPGARRKSVAEYIKRIEKIESLANSLEGVEQSYAIQAGREIRVIAKSDKVDDAHVALLASDIAQKIQQEMDYPGKVKVTVIREMRAVDYAK
ncbi:MAG: ribonuclease Y [Acidobacteriota bacterium]